jgi:hypothetical protein
MTIKLVEELAKQLVRNNLENFNIMVDEGEEEPTANNFKEYGICEENVESIIKHYMSDIIKRTRELQESVSHILFVE